MSILSTVSLGASAVSARWGEPYFTEAINKSNLGLRRGIARGFRLEPVAESISLRVALDETSADALAAIEQGALAFTVRLTSAQVISLATWRGQTVYVALYATYSVGHQSTCAIRICNAAELEEDWWVGAVKLGRVAVPAEGDLAAADIDTSIADYAWAGRGYGDVEWENLAPTPALDHWHAGLPIGWHKINANDDDPEQDDGGDAAGVPPTAGIAMRFISGMSPLGLGEFTVHAGERIHMLLRGRGAAGSVTLSMLSSSPDGGFLGIHADETRQLVLTSAYENWTNLSTSFVAGGNRSVLVTLTAAADSEAYIDEVQILREPTASKLRRVVDRTRPFGNLAGRMLELWTSLYEDATVAMRVTAEGMFDQFRDATPTFTFKGLGGAAAILAGIKQITGIANEDVTITPAAGRKVKLATVVQVATPTAASTSDTDVVPDDIATVSGDAWAKRVFASGAAFLYGAATSTTRFAKVLAQGGALLSREAAGVPGGGGFVFLGDAKRGPADMPVGFEQKPYYGSEATGVYRVLHPQAQPIAAVGYYYDGSLVGEIVTEGAWGLRRSKSDAFDVTNDGKVVDIYLETTAGELALLTGVPSPVGAYGKDLAIEVSCCGRNANGYTDLFRRAVAYPVAVAGAGSHLRIRVKTYDADGVAADDTMVWLRVYPAGRLDQFSE